MSHVSILLGNEEKRRREEDKVYWWEKNIGKKACTGKHGYILEKHGLRSTFQQKYTIL